MELTGGTLQLTYREAQMIPDLPALDISVAAGVSLALDAWTDTVVPTEMPEDFKAKYDDPFSWRMTRMMMAQNIAMRTGEHCIATALTAEILPAIKWSAELAVKLARDDIAEGLNPGLARSTVDYLNQMEPPLEDGPMTIERLEQDTRRDHQLEIIRFKQLISDVDRLSE